VEKQPLWRCPECGRRFANRNQFHFCGRYELEHHFVGKSPRVREIYEGFLVMLEEFGPVTVLPEKTRIAFQSRTSFAQLTVRREWVVGHFVLARRADDPVFTKIEKMSPRTYVHDFRLDSPEEVERLRPWAAEAAAVGRQEHLSRI